MKKTKTGILISGTNQSGPFTIQCEEFFHKNEGVILIGTVTKGTVNKGDNIVLNRPNSNDTLTDTVKELQIDKRSVDCAPEGKSIGICLERTTMDEMVSLNEEALV